MQYNGRQVQGFLYLKPFDQRYIAHLLGILLAVVKFGGQGFSKIARGTPISRTLHSGLLEKTRDGKSSACTHQDRAHQAAVGSSIAETTYMDVAVGVLLR